MWLVATILPSTILDIGKYQPELVINRAFWCLKTGEILCIFISNQINIIDSVTVTSFLFTITLRMEIFWRGKNEFFLCFCLLI